MFLHRVQSTYGRLIPKPRADDKVEEILDEAIPIQDQIEALRTKIQLKERYNRVLKDELEESRLGASSILQDLYVETTDLRVQLVEAINSEKAAVQNALRTHREFQLAMTDKVPGFAIGWLEDKLYDLSGQLNLHLNRLVERRGALETAEHMVLQIEKWPRPGSLPWETEAIANFHRLENLIENMKVNLETANILHTNYHQAKYILREEKGKYNPVLRNMEEQIRNLAAERTTLQKMLDDAVYFRDEAQKNLTETEKEASENRKKRRLQMSKMKKAVNQVLDANHQKIQAPEAHGGKPVDNNKAKSDFLEILRVKRLQMEEYQNRARTLVETMRVPDLTFIPTRFRSVMSLGERLQLGQAAKERMRNNLLREKDQLYLIMCQFSYTGLKLLNEFKEREQTYHGIFEEIEKNKRELIKTLNQYGDIIVNLRLIAIALLDRIDEGRRRHQIKDDFPETLKMIIQRVKRLVGNVKYYEDLFTEPPTRNYVQYIKNPPITSRLIRVGSPAQSDESDEEEIIDMKIPTRLDIKAKSQKVIHQAMLKRGLKG